MTPKRIVYYRDARNDDFAATKDKITRRKVDGGYRYEKKGPAYRVFSALLYRGVVTPVVALYVRAGFGLRIKGKRNLRAVKGGYFLYGNHTQNVIDAFLPSLVSFPRRCRIITGQETVSIPFVRHITPMLGAIPLPDTLKGAVNFEACVGREVRSSAVALYPEAHIWPYCTFIRPFSDQSFLYPVRFGRPAVPFTVTYRERRIFQNTRPLVTVTIGKPIRPDPDLPPREARKALRDKVFAAMNETASAPGNAEYIAYRPYREESAFAASDA